MASNRTKYVSNARRVVVKVGTSSITDGDFKVSVGKIKKIVGEVVGLRKKGIEVIIVSSGAIGAGVGLLELKSRPRDINVLQATAAVGQNELMKAYGKAFAKEKIKVAQLLLTRDDFQNRMRYLNIRNTLTTLIKMGVVPIINENDSVAVDEIRFGDNDNLAALVAANLGADLLIMLSSMDGIHTWDPSRSRRAEAIRVVEKIDSKIERLSGKSRGGGVGGVASKISAAKAAVNSGVTTIVVDSAMDDILARVMKGDLVGTLFTPKKKMESREHWILYSSKSKGKIIVDAGAKKALMGKCVSLLPSGVVRVEGSFKKGDPVSIVDERGREFARGIINYSTEDARKIAGSQSRDIEKILGKKSYKEIIYCGNLVFV